METAQRMATPTYGDWTMNMQHEIKISSFIFPVVRVNNDESVIVESGGFKARFIPGKGKLVFTDKKGKIQSMEIKA